MKKLLSVFLIISMFIFACGIGLLIFNLGQQIDYVDKLSCWSKETRHRNYIENIVDRLNVAQTSVELSYVAPSVRNTAFEKDLNFKLATMSFQEAEALLEETKNLYEATVPIVKEKEKEEDSLFGPPTGPPTPEATPQEPSMPPAVKAKLDQAIELYKISKIYADKLLETKDPEYNFSINYLKGEIYHRHTQLLATQETGPELLNQTVAFYKKALQFKPGNINTVANIEFLINQSKGNSGGAPPGPAKPQPQKLLRQGAGTGHSKGN